MTGLRAVTATPLRVSDEVAGRLLSALGFLLLGVALLWLSVRYGGRAYDFSAYWLAGRHVLEGQPLYAAERLGQPGAFWYPPVFAYLAVPVALIPEIPATWLYRFFAVLCLRYLVGSWRAVGWALLFPPVIMELVALNVTLPIAALARWSLRGPRMASGAALLPAAAALKFGPLLLIGYLWVRRPAVRGALIVGSGVVLSVFAVHALVDPAAWSAFAGSLAHLSVSSERQPLIDGYLVVLSSARWWDFALRVAIAVGLLFLALRRRADWLAFAASALAVPALWLAQLAPLAAVVRLRREERRAEGSATPPAG